MTMPILGMDSGKCRRTWVRLASAFALVIVLIVMLRWWEHSQIYHPSREFEAVDVGSRHLFEDVRFRTQDGVELNGWFFAAKTNSARAQWAFLVCHGNGGNISHRLELCKSLLEAGANVFIFDYRGYGKSEGRPGEEGTYLDAQAAYAWLRQKGFHGGNMIGFGESLGGAVITELALRENLGGIILQSTFTSIPDVGKELFPWLPVKLINTIKYDTHAKLPRINVPVLVMHSRDDDLVRFHHAKTNFAAANEPKQFCELSGMHNEAAWEQPGFREAVESFLKLIKK